MVERSQTKQQHIARKGEEKFRNLISTSESLREQEEQEAFGQKAIDSEVTALHVPY